MSRTRLLLVAAAVAALLVAVGTIGALTRDSTKPTTFVLPKCARPTRSVHPPPPFPPRLPLPKGTVFSTLARYPKVVVVSGRAPLELLPATRFFVRELPRKGFRLGPGESEPGFEAEGGFTGDGIVGRFKVRVLPRCRGASLLVVSIGRSGPVTVAPALPVRGRLPVCAGAGAGIASGLPPSFPLPSGTVVRSSRKHTDRSRPFDFVSAVAPGTIEGAAKFILHRLPRAGYRLVQADRETYEAEAAFAGHGIKGRVRFHSLLACEGVLTVDIATWRP